MVANGSVSAESVCAQLAQVSHQCFFLQGEAKEEMMLAMGLNTEEEGSAMAFLRRGYKVVPFYCMLGN